MIRLLAFLALVSTARADELPLTVAARERQQLIRTADFKYRTESVGVGYLPPVQEGRLLLDGQKFRQELRAPTKLGVDGTVQIETFDGSTRRAYWRGVPAGMHQPTSHGTLSREAKAFPKGELPLLFSCRGLDSSVLPTAERWELCQPRITLFGNVFDVYEYRIGLRNPGRMWVVPSCGHMLAGSGDAAGESRLTVKSRFHADSGVWLPESWETLNRGRVTSSTTLTSVEINHPVPAEEFTITFPVGTRVDRGHEPPFLVGENGQELPVPPVRFSPPPSSRPVSFSRADGMAIVIVATGVLLVVIVAFRLRGRPKAQA